MQGIQILLRGARKTVPSYYLSTLWKPRRRDPAQLRRKHVKRVSETWCTALYSPIFLLSGTETSAMDAGLRIRRGFESSPVNSPHVFLRFVWEGKRGLARRSNPHAIARARAHELPNEPEKGFRGFERGPVTVGQARNSRTRKENASFYCLVFVAAPLL